MVVGFVSRLGWRPGGRAPLVVVRLRTADGGDSDSAVICALFERNLVYALGCDFEIFYLKFWFVLWIWSSGHVQNFDFNLELFEFWFESEFIFCFCDLKVILWWWCGITFYGGLLLTLVWFLICWLKVVMGVREM